MTVDSSTTAELIEGLIEVIQIATLLHSQSFNTQGSIHMRKICFKSYSATNLNMWMCAGLVHLDASCASHGIHKYV